MEFFKKTNIDFIGTRKVAYTVSIILVIIGIVSIIVRGGLNFGIDFVGGTLVQMNMEPMPEIGELRKVLSDNGYKTAQIQRFAGTNEVIVRFKKGEILTVEEIQFDSISNSSTAAVVTAQTGGNTQVGGNMSGGKEAMIGQMFLKAFPQSKLEITRIEMVGPTVGKKLLSQAILALFWGMIGIMVYVGIRFEFKYSAPAVLAIFHDVFVVTGILVLTNREVDMTVIAALLTIVGYSINDTIVIYDRIREKVRLYAKDEIGKVMNVAINDTLSRTVITGSSTIFVLTTLLIFGGEVLSNFAFTLLIGTVIGTYSSVFVASPLVYEWEMMHRKK
jgi:preprotein translocase subunit SecF